jgi:hypothetical protein
VRREIRRWKEREREGERRIEIKFACGALNIL